ncbi:IPTL-CTERM sorting domain-containing protein [Brevundimonas sp.]|uniref:IPTL-CTERM sorting domain-containing protein n=1 Tax=Brevundimonas sp. TaxID=1871086 RepID=UPI00289D4C7B|nr:IPTL-CTERM sorting domain-containing protein [Brevundimonas sp.]
MKSLLGGLVAAACLTLASQAAAQTVTYYVQSAPYDSVSNYTGCPLGGCTATYTTSQRVSGSFTIFGALTPNMVDEIVDVRLGDLNLSDGQNTFQTDFLNWSIVSQTAQISTDASGNLTYFEFKFDKMHGSPATFGNAADPKSYVTSIYLGNTAGGSYAYVQSNSLCTSRGDNTGGNTYGLGCATQTSIPAQGASQASASAVTISLTPPPPPTVPTMSEWAMILLGALLAGGAALHLQRRRQTA